MSEVEEERKFQFLRDGDAEPSELDWNKGIESARKAISEAMNAKNIAFLLGAGCSSLMKDKKELGIATMAPLAKEFCGETIEARAAGFYSDPPTAGAVPAPWRLTKDELDYLDALGFEALTAHRAALIADADRRLGARGAASVRLCAGRGDEVRAEEDLHGGQSSHRHGDIADQSGHRQGERTEFLR